MRRWPNIGIPLGATLVHDWMTTSFQHCFLHEKNKVPTLVSNVVPMMFDNIERWHPTFSQL